MPRQLPWANKGGGSRTQPKPAPAQRAAKPHISSTIDDDFFDGTVLATGKGKDRAIESDDDLPGTPRTKTRKKDALRKRREESSSPPPVDDFEQPSVEGMHEGVSKFDLRDDEWMMVEDEFLETAKLFTRHLHMAEYEKLKKSIEEKKKQAEIARPVVADAKLSVTAVMKEKAKVQEQKQKRAIRDVFASQNDTYEDGEAEVQDTVRTRTNASRTISSFMTPHNPPISILKQPPNPYEAKESDSEDLDAPRCRQRSTSKTATVPAPTSTRTQISSTSVQQTPISPTSTKTRAQHSTFVKPAHASSATKPRSRISRATPFDMLDDWVPKKAHSSPQSSAGVPIQSPVARRTSSSSTTSPPFSQSTSASVDTRAPENVYNVSTSKETVNRIAKRKAEREKQKQKEKQGREREKKLKEAKVDDIPTFLF